MQSKGTNKHEEKHNNHRQFKRNFQSSGLFSEILIILFLHHISRVLVEWRSKIENKLSETIRRCCLFRVFFFYQNLLQSHVNIYYFHNFINVGVRLSDFCVFSFIIICAYPYDGFDFKAISH